MGCVQCLEGRTERACGFHDLGGIGCALDAAIEQLQPALGDAVAAALATPGDTNHATAVAVLKQALPDLVSTDFYRPDLSDVLGTDFAKFC